MSVQQSINQSILAAGVLYSQSGADEQRKGKLEFERAKKNLKAANEKLPPKLPISVNTPGTKVDCTCFFI